MAKVEANKVKIAVEPTPIKPYGTVALSYQQALPRGAPIHYTPMKNIDVNAPSNQQVSEALKKEEARIYIMDIVARALRSDYRLPEKIIVGRNEYDLIKVYRVPHGYISISAWERFNQKCIVRVKMAPSSFTIQRNEKVQATVVSIVDTCLESAASFPHTISIDGTTYITSYSYAPGSSTPPREGWLNITVDHNFTHIANVHFVESKDVAPV